jgi:hypothetical protein
MRDPAPNHHAIKLPVAVQVIAIATLATQQNRILLTRNRLADAEFLSDVQ